MLENASLMARFASLVYLPEEELKIKLSQMGYDKFHWIDIEDTQAMIIPPYQDNQLVICFRGTEPDQLTDVLADLKAWRKPSKEKGLVHYGFVEALDKVFPTIEYLLESMDISLEKPLKVVCTGHSLGAALATLCASRIDAHELYTFGSPRVGNRDFVNELVNDGIKHYRFVNNNDIVTKVPLSLMMYKHCGELCYINYHGNIRKMTPWQRIKDQFRGILRAWQKGEPFDGARDHSISAYEKKLENVCLQSKS